MLMFFHNPESLVSNQLNPVCCCQRNKYYGLMVGALEVVGLGELGVASMAAEIFVQVQNFITLPRLQLVLRSMLSVLE